MLGNQLGGSLSLAVNGRFPCLVGEVHVGAARHHQRHAVHLHRLLLGGDLHGAANLVSRQEGFTPLIVSDNNSMLKHDPSPGRA